jgi:hypothetical protein
MDAKEFMRKNEEDRRGPKQGAGQTVPTRFNGSVDVTLVLSCGTHECKSHGSHDQNASGSTACMAMTGWCSKWSKSNAANEPRSE